MNRAVLVLMGLLSGVAAAQAVARLQTPPLPSGPTCGFDTAIWVNPVDRAESLVFASDQLGTTGVVAYDLDGFVVTQLTGGSARGLDVRYAVPFAGGLVDLLLVARVAGTLELFVIEPNRTLTPVGSFVLNALPQAAALSFDRASQTLTGYVGDTAGNVIKVTFIAGATAFTATEDGRVPMGATVFGLTADEGTGHVYYSTSTGTLGVLTVQPFGLGPVIDTAGTHLFAPLGGVAQYGIDDGGSVLLVAMTASNTIASYAFDNGAWGFATMVNLTSDAGPVGQTIGIDVAGAAIGGFDGLFVAHDGLNPSGPDVKVYAWSDLAGNAVTGSLPISNSEVGPWVVLDADGGPGVDGGTGGGAGGGAGGGPSGVGRPPLVPGDVPETSTCGCTASGASALVLGAVLWLTRRKSRR